MKRVATLGTLLGLGVGALSAQTRTNTDVPWLTSHFPYLTLSPNDGVFGLARIIHFRVAEFEDRISLRDALAVEAGYSTRNSWTVRARGDFPRIADGWRLETDGELAGTPRFGGPENFQERLVQTINAEVTRRIHGSLQLAGRAGVTHLSHRLSWFDAATLYPGTPAESPCQYLADPGGDDTLDDCSPTIRETDARGRIALVLDLRTREYETTQGALLEFGVFGGSAGGGYHGSYGIARGWIAPAARLRLTSRVGFRGLSRSAAFGIQHEIPAWEHSLITLGGPNSQRGLSIGEESGRGVLLGGIEGRYDVFNAGDLGALSVLAFADGSRSFRDLSPLVDPVPGAPIEDGDLRFTTERWKVSLGGGVGIRVLKASQLNVTFAHGDGRTAWYVSSGWSW